eukprot:9032414-Prorocentrum_lima.AAC.1
MEAEYHERIGQLEIGRTLNCKFKGPVVLVSSRGVTLFFWARKEQLLLVWLNFCPAPPVAQGRAAART